MEFQVQGRTTPVVAVTLAAGEQIGSEPGELGWLRGDIQIQTGTSVAGQQGGFLKAAKRAFGGTGFMLQRLSGSGRAHVELHGDVVEFDLAAGEKLRTSPGHVGLFDASVTLELTTIPGIKNKLFGGEGLFLTELVGPGKVWLKSTALADLAQALSPHLVSNREVTEVGAAGVGTAFLGGLL